MPPEVGDVKSDGDGSSQSLPRPGGPTEKTTETSSVELRGLSKPPTLRKQADVEEMSVAGSKKR
jgi:hypothetical protein